MAAVPARPVGRCERTPCCLSVFGTFQEYSASFCWSWGEREHDAEELREDVPLVFGCVGGEKTSVGVR